MDSKEMLANLIYKHRNRLKQRIFKWNPYISEDDRNDILQDLYLKVSGITVLDTSNEPKFLNYIQMCLHHLLIDKYRKAKIQGFKTEVQDDMIIQDFEYDDTPTFNLKELLNPRFYDTFIMYVEGYKYEEIAEKMDVPLGTIKARIHNAKKQLEPYRESYLKDKI